MWAALYEEEEEEKKTISPSQWKNAQCILGVLEPLHDATLILSAFVTPTIHLVLPIIFGLQAHMDSCLGIAHSLGDSVLEDAVTAMREKFMKYFEVMPPSYILCHILDPAYKMDLIAFHFKGIFICIIDCHYLTHTSIQTPLPKLSMLRITEILLLECVWTLIATTNKRTQAPQV